VTDPTGFIESICSFADKNREYEVLMPVDAETYVVAQYREAIRAAAPHLSIPFHEYGYLQMANDKRQVAELARRIGVPIPQTYYPSSIEEAERIAGQIQYPAVIKIPTAKGGLGMTYVYARDEAVSTYRDTITKHSLDSAHLPIIQEYIPGTDYGVACLFNHAQLRAKIVFRSIRDRPPSGGQMVVRVSVLHEQMVEYLVALAVEMNWHGVIMADFRLDKRDNTPKLIEINPRFWGSLYQAIAAGVEFPYLLYKMALDGDVSPVLDYEVGVRTRYLWADLKALPSHLRVSNNRLRLVRAFLDFGATKYDDLSISDPLPVMAMAANIPIRLAGAGRGSGSDH
jgi:predicted ATP-grasp superfamily ATP-dependent carboligase